ncbi:uncharacterized protein LOC133841174 [Drosophila sulfurigaster albostrigata]|uniref:uncharacterized protein LOC133841174 n=1 Tax=Drosophila sulfurigaster albostrigata TaxID=89887 RepID=UPI002D2184B7|nr:uncharacterized protein LOC133841174 [Drosophila sulfurigaster albostrigata]
MEPISLCFLVLLLFWLLIFLVYRCAACGEDCETQETPQLKKTDTALTVLELAADVMNTSNNDYYEAEADFAVSVIEVAAEVITASSDCGCDGASMGSNCF